MELMELLCAARERLQVVRLEQIATQKQASIEAMEEEFVALALSQNAGVGCRDGADAADVDPDKLCVVCLAGTKEFVFLPCAHFCV